MGSRAESSKNKGFSCTWDSLRNSAGEKILELRSHPLNMPSDSNFCSLLSELSLEQRFDISYLDLGESALGERRRDVDLQLFLFVLFDYFNLVVPFRCRGAQPERPVSVSGRALHAANHSVPWLCPKHRGCQSQRCPQCTKVPQNHGWRKVKKSKKVPTPSRHPPHNGMDLRSGHRKHFCDRFEFTRKYLKF